MSGDFVEGAPACPISPLDFGLHAFMGFLGSRAEIFPISRRHSRGRRSGTFRLYSPCALGLSHFGTSADPYLDRYFRVSREVAFEFMPMWRGCEGDPCCAVTRGRDGHLVERSASRLNILGSAGSYGGHSSRELRRTPFHAWISAVHAFVGFVGMVHEFGSEFGIDRALRREVGFEASMCCLARCALGLRRFGPLHRPLPRSGTRSTFGVSREVTFEFSPLWPCCEGDPLCAVFQFAIGHLVDIQIW